MLAFCPTLWHTGNRFRKVRCQNDYYFLQNVSVMKTDSVCGGELVSAGGLCLCRKEIIQIPEQAKVWFKRRNESVPAAFFVS